MKKYTLTFLLILIASSLSAQVTVINSEVFKATRSASISAKVTDALNSEPIGFASVYLIPDKDTVITHFTLTDSDGHFSITDIPYGRYNLNIEFVGYKTYTKEYYFKEMFEKDLGEIKIEPDPERLKEAVVSAAANAIIVKQDTIEYNASSFHVRENAMLGDLLKKMPGIEVGKDGSVSVNGEQVKKITVGGKTFFFDDPSTAVNNLPAKMVDKVKVIDKETDEARFTGISAGSGKEKVMDLELKEEYTHGWFGNATLGGGSTLMPEGNEDILKDSRGLLYSGNALLTGYNEKDQLTVLANAANISDGMAAIVIFSTGDEDDSEISGLGGLNTNRQLGANLNSSRIKGMDANVSANYKYNQNDARERAFRATEQPDDIDIMTDRTESALTTSNGFTTAMELKNLKQDKILFTFNPKISFSRDESLNNVNSETSRLDTRMNRSASSTSTLMNKFNGSTSMNLGLKNLGKTGRSITWIPYITLTDNEGNSSEYSETVFADTKSVKDLRYDRETDKFYLSNTLRYVEPLSTNWYIQASYDLTYIKGKTIKDAFNSDGSENDYYSSLTDNLYLKHMGRALLQYSKDMTNIQFGLAADAVKDETEARSLGITTFSGQGEWLWNWSPFLNAQLHKGSTSYTILYSGNTIKPSNSRLLPTLDISNPTSITAGNIYLKPYFRSSLHLMTSGNNKKTFSSWSLSGYGTLTSHPVVYANWHDSDGILYEVPVNSQKPSVMGQLYGYYRKPFGKSKDFRLSISPVISFNRATSYQSVSRLEGLDLENFDYSEFMEKFWGDSSGNIFYSGRSGFAESNTSSVNERLGIDLTYSHNALDFTLRSSFRHQRSWFSLDPSANMNTWGNMFSFEISYVTRHEFELSNDFGYSFYRGYSEGFGEDEFPWNIEISKNIKTFTLSLSVNDILNSQKSLQRTVMDSYREDTYSNIMGRYILFKAAFNFGKVNAKQSAKSQQATWNLY